MPKPLLVGFGSSDITPALPCELNGFAMREQPALGIGGPLRARVMVLKRARACAVLAVCDLLGFTPADSVRLEKRLGRVAGVPFTHVFLACTHTHSGPMSMPLGAVGTCDRGYVALVGQRLASAAERACGDLRPVQRVRLAVRGISHLGTFRCGRREPGRSRWPGKLTAVRFVRESGPAVTVVHVGIHPYVLGPKNRAVHPDYPGEACAALERQGAGHALLLPGCGADVEAAVAWRTSLEDAASFGGNVASEALAALRRARGIADAPFRLTCLAPRVRFGFRAAAAEPNLRRVREARQVRERLMRNAREYEACLQQGVLPRSRVFRVRLMRLGSLALVGMPAEIFHDTGADLARACAKATVLTLSQTGGDVGYLPRPFAYRGLTYETTSAHRWYRTKGAPLPGSEERVRRSALCALTGLFTRD